MRWKGGIEDHRRQWASDNRWADFANQVLCMKISWNLGFAAVGCAVKVVVQYTALSCSETFAIGFLLASIQAPKLAATGCKS